MNKRKKRRMEEPKNKENREKQKNEDIEWLRNDERVTEHYYWQTKV